MLSPLPYHQDIANFLEANAPSVWAWYADARQKDSEIEAIKLELLKSTYRIEDTSQPELYDLIRSVCDLFEVEAPIQCYQAQNPEGLNASLVYIPDELHLVFYGPVAETLNDTEMKALIGHEVSHFLLNNGWAGRYSVAHHVLMAMCNDAGAESVHWNSLRYFTLHTELFCDRGGYAACGDLLSTISALVKISTGVESIDPESYLRQADDIFGREKPVTEGITHPESYIRARALRLWAEEDDALADQVDGMIRGRLALNALDLIGQDRVADWTRKLLDAMLHHPWIQTESILAQAHLFFEDYTVPGEQESPDALVEHIQSAEKSLQTYYLYILLDFVVSDPELEDVPAAAALRLAEHCGLADRFQDLLKTELKMTKRVLERLVKDRDTILEAAAKSHGEAAS